MADVYGRYLNWLEEQINPDRTDRSYRELYKILLDKEFVWLTPNDDNRVADGLEIRYEFFSSHAVIDQGCSVLEVLISLSRRMSFAAGGDSESWAWQLIKNLELDGMSGRIGKTRADRIDDILEKLIWRVYEPDGCGGFFPLAWSKLDQRKVELWYQMCAYIDELPEL